MVVIALHIQAELAISSAGVVQFSVDNRFYSALVGGHMGLIIINLQKSCGWDGRSHSGVDSVGYCGDGEGSHGAQGQIGPRVEA